MPERTEPELTGSYAELVPGQGTECEPFVISVNAVLMPLRQSGQPIAEICGERKDHCASISA